MRAYGTSVLPDVGNVEIAASGDYHEVFTHCFSGFLGCLDKNSSTILSAAFPEALMDGIDTFTGIRSVFGFAAL